MRCAGADDAGVAGNPGQLAVMATIARCILANAAQEQAHVFRAAMMHRNGFPGPETGRSSPWQGRALAALRASSPNAQFMSAYEMDDPLHPTTYQYSPKFHKNIAIQQPKELPFQTKASIYPIAFF